MERMSFETMGPNTSSGKSIAHGEHIFRPERECIAALVYNLGQSVDQNLLVSKMVKCDFHLDAIEKVKAFTGEEYAGFVKHILNTYLNSQHTDFIGNALLEDFRESCKCCK